MKITLINHSDTRGGASVVAMRLLEGLRRQGIDARMLVCHRATSSPHVAVAGSALRRKAAFLAECADIFMHNGRDRADMFKVSVAVAGLPLHRHPWVRHADALILNWVNQGMLSLRGIDRLCAPGRPVVWTMHDMWNLTGICHHAATCTRYCDPGGCACCPMLHSSAGPHDISARTWRRKKTLYDRAYIHFVAVSSWLARKCADATLMHDRRLSVIPNAFPVDDFYIEPRRDRADIGLPRGKKIIIMGAARLDDDVKGLPLAVEALNRLADSGRTDAHAVFFGALRNSEALGALRLPHTWLGTVDDPAVIRELYAHSTAVLSSSLYETLPGTLIEGQAAGCFPVSFGEGGQADIIDHGVTGYIARYCDTADLAAGLAVALDGAFDPEALRRSVVARFSADVIARRYLRLLNEQFSH